MNAKEILTKTVLVIIGLVVGKMAAKALQQAGVTIFV